MFSVPSADPDQEKCTGPNASDDLPIHSNRCSENSLKENTHKKNPFLPVAATLAANPSPSKYA